MERASQMKWFHFPQFENDTEIVAPAKHVLIEAESPTEANRIAKENGIYFSDDRRWTVIAPDDEGKNQPTIYGFPLEFFENVSNETGLPGILLIDRTGERRVYV
jgi:hypothetical protein